MVAISVSCDGLRWSRFTPLVNSTDAGGGRTYDHPVHGFLREGTRVLFFVHRNVPGIAPGPSRLTRVAVELEDLAAFTRASLPRYCSYLHASLRADVGTPPLAPGVTEF